MFMKKFKNYLLSILRAGVWLRGIYGTHTCPRYEGLGLILSTKNNASISPSPQTKPQIFFLSFIVGGLSVDITYPFLCWASGLVIYTSSRLGIAFRVSISCRYFLVYWLSFKMFMICIYVYVCVCLHEFICTTYV